MKKEISRRNFIKGTAALTAGAALMGLAGCAEEKTPAPQEAPKSKHVKVAVFSPTPGRPGILSAVSPISAFRSMICFGIYRQSAPALPDFLPTSDR